MNKFFLLLCALMLVVGCGGAQGFGEGDAVADCGAFAVGRDYVNFAQVLDGVLQGVKAGGLNAIVIAKQDSHGWR